MYVGRFLLHDVRLATKPFSRSQRLLFAEGASSRRCCSLPFRPSSRTCQIHRSMDRSYDSSPLKGLILSQPGFFSQSLAPFLLVKDLGWFWPNDQIDLVTRERPALEVLPIWQQYLLFECQ